jgi:hypothetical protein
VVETSRTAVEYKKLTANDIMNAGSNRKEQFIAEPEGDSLFGMANLSPKRTGLPFVVWISPKAGALHDVPVKVSTGPKVHPSELISVAIRPDVHVVGGGKMTRPDLDLLRKWIALNRDVIVKYWDGEIEYTEDAIAEIKPLC